MVEDDAEVRALIRAWLETAGYEVGSHADAESALEDLSAGHADVVLTDISLPGMSGIEFLREVRARDLDVPVLLVTGDPRLETAIEAVEYGAARYLLKPVHASRLLDEVRRATRLGGLARLKREALLVSGLHWSQLGDRAALEARFERALASVWPAFQPIVRLSDRTVYGYEALLRSDEPTLPAAEDLLGAGERLGRAVELGRALRRGVARAAANLPPDALLFVNCGAEDLFDEDLLVADASLHPWASRVVFEVTERAPLGSPTRAAKHVARLRKLGYRIAVDDLGAGYAGLSALLHLDPEVVKLDMGLVRGVDTDPARRRVIGSMLALCRDLSMETIIEGVQTEAERDALVELGGDLLQGYLFGRPGRTFEPPTF